MSWLGWVVIGLLAALFVWEIIFFLPDKMPWNKRRKQ